MKNTSLSSKNNTLISILEPQFKGKINLARIKLICLFIDALIKVKTVNYNKLSIAFVCKSSNNSSFRRIQRFMADFDFPMEIVSKLIFSLLPQNDNLTLVLDRTNWKFGIANINILMLGVSYKNVAFPLMFKMLDKRGNSSSQERIDLIKDYIKWFGADTIDCILADREFVGEKWLAFLNDEKIRYYIRIRNNFKVYLFHKQTTVSVNWLFNKLKIKEFEHYGKIVELHGQKCYLTGCKTITRENGNELLILVSFNRPQEALEYYKIRWEVETLFRALKSSGFNIEDTHVIKLERLENLLLLVIIAFTWCYKIGDYIDTNIKKIKIKNNGRRAITIFKYGLDYISNYLFTKIKRHKFNIFDFLSCT